MPNYKNKHVECSKTIKLSHPVARVFPMFQPEGEKSWTAGWNPQYVWPRDGLPREGLVFTHDNGKGGESIWTMTRFDPQDHRIEYTVVSPESHVTRIQIRCNETLPGATSTTISYAVTPISERGLSVLKQFAPRDYEDRINAWQMAIDHFFDTGEASEVH